MISPTLKKQFLYTGMTHELRIAPLNKTWGAPWEGVPLNLADMLTPHQKQRGGGNLPGRETEYGWRLAALRSVL